MPLLQNPNAPSLHAFISGAPSLRASARPESARARARQDAHALAKREVAKQLGSTSSRMAPSDPSYLGSVAPPSPSKLARPVTPDETQFYDGGDFLGEGASPRQSAGDKRRFAGDSFIEHIQELELPSLHASSIGTVISVDNPLRECHIDFGTGVKHKRADGSFGGDVYAAKLEEVEVVQCNEDFAAEDARVEAQVESTRARAVEAQRRTSRLYKRQHPPPPAMLAAQSLPRFAHATHPGHGPCQHSCKAV